jgi:hypothetical protein
MPLSGGEVRMRLKTQLPRVLKGTEHQLAGQLDGRLQRITLIPVEEAADKGAQAKIVHDLRAKSVFHPEAIGVHEIATDRDLAVPVLASDQHRDQAFSPGARILLQRPAGLLANGQARAPARAEPAASHRRLRRLGVRHDGRVAHQAGRGSGPDSQRAGDLLGGLSPIPQCADTVKAVIRLHEYRS